MSEASEEPVRPIVLIADDDADIRSLLRAHLEVRPCTLLEARNGEEALEAIIVEQPDLVLLDVMMPVVNGWQICQYVREKEGLDHVGILMLTAIGSKVNEMTSPLYGADAYLDKPFDLDDLDVAIRQVLEKRLGSED